MRKRYRGNDSAIGTAMHLEKKCYNAKKHTTSKRSRYKCIHYEYCTRDCKVLRILCVGPSNPLCRNYCEQGKHRSPIEEGVLVQDEYMGTGVIIKVSSASFRVQFVGRNRQISYFKKDVKKVKAGIIYT